MTGSCGSSCSCAAAASACTAPTVAANNSSSCTADVSLATSKMANLALTGTPSLYSEVIETALPRQFPQEITVLISDYALGYHRIPAIMNVFRPFVRAEDLPEVDEMTQLLRQGVLDLGRMCVTISWGALGAGPTCDDQDAISHIFSQLVGESVTRYAVAQRPTHIITPFCYTKQVGSVWEVPNLNDVTLYFEPPSYRTTARLFIGLTVTHAPLYQYTNYFKDQDIKNHILATQATTANPLYCAELNLQPVVQSCGSTTKPKPEPFLRIFRITGNPFTDYPTDCSLSGCNRAVVYESVFTVRRVMEVLKGIWPVVTQDN